MSPAKIPPPPPTTSTEEDIPPDSPIGPRFAALRNELGLAQLEVVRRLRAAHDRDPDVAAIEQSELSKFENNRRQASTVRVLRALGAVYDVSIDDLDRYALRGTITLAELIAIRARGIVSKSPHDTYRKHPQWAQLIVEARSLRKHLRPATFEQLADTPVTWATLGSLTPHLLAELADTVQRWIDADTGEP